MRASTSWVLFLVVAVTGFSLAQPPAGEKVDGKKSLDDHLTSALRNSPDVQVAEAKIREAQVELRRTKFMLIQKVIEGSNNVDAARAGVAHAEVSFKRLSALHGRGTVSAEELSNAEAQLAKSKAQLAQAEAALNGLTGTLPPNVAGIVGAAGMSDVAVPQAHIPQGAQLPGGMAATANLGVGGGAVGLCGGVGFGGGGGSPTRRAPSGPMTEKLRKALNASVKVKPVKETPVKDLIEMQKAAAPGVPFVLHLGNDPRDPVSFSLEGDVPLGAVLQAMEDVVPGLKFYVREYGILATITGHEPEDGMPLIEFWQMPGM